MYQITWFDTVKSSKIRCRLFYDLHASGKQPFDTPTSCTFRGLVSASTRASLWAFRKAKKGFWNSRAAASSGLPKVEARTAKFVGASRIAGLRTPGASWRTIARQMGVSAKPARRAGQIATSGDFARRRKASEPTTQQGLRLLPQTIRQRSSN